MCGILGKLCFDSSETIDRHEFRKALDLLEHRGPDSSGVHISRGLGFGHRRLSIIDLTSDADQPMLSFDRRVVVIFNGEIYNFRELREELIAKGCVFRTRGDTEVLLHAYREYGERFVERLRGMFAFAIHDFDEQCTLIYRDRIGVKPLYVARSARHLVFASEPKAILALRSETPSLNLNAVSSYFSFRYPILNDTFFEGIEAVEPGTYWKVHAGQITKRKYWDPRDAFQGQAHDRGEKFYIERLRELLETAVKYRLIADVRTGAFLSGGVDSSVLTAVMAQNSNDPIRTFTIGFAEAGFNEFEYANLVANAYGTKHREITLSGEDYLENMLSLINFKDAPLSVPNEVPLYLMSRELKRHITVVLSGEGADEIFGGYGRIFRSCDEFERTSIDELAKLDDHERTLFSESFRSKYGVKRFDAPVDHLLSNYRYTGVEEKRQFLGEHVTSKSIEEGLERRFVDLFSELEGESYFNKLSWVFTKIHVPGLLYRVDTTTMATSVEARVPFLDHELVEFAFSVPRKYKLKWKSAAAQRKSRALLGDEISEKYDIPKHLLKKAYEGDIDDRVLYRRKMGFPVPLGEWFGRKFHSFARDVLLDSASANRGLFNLKGVRDWLDEDRLASNPRHAQTVWMMVNLELFCRQCLDNNGAARLR